MSPNLIAPLPTVKVGGKTYSVKYAHAAIYLLSTWGIDLSRIFETLAEALGFPAQEYVPATEDAPEILAHPEVRPNGQRTSLMAKIAAAGLGVVDKNGVWRSAGLDPIGLMEQLRDEEAEHLDTVTWEAFAKKIGLPLESKKATPAGAPVTAITTPKDSGSVSGHSEPGEPVSD